VDDSSFGATPLARISITGETGRFYAPKDALIFADDGFDRSERPFERHYYYRAKFGSSEIEAPAGKLTIEISQGLETKPLTLNAIVKPGENTIVHAQLLPLEFNPPKGPRWASADLHVHMNYGGTYRVKPEDLVEIGEAEGLKFTNELTVNKEQRFPDIQFLNFSDATSLASTGMQDQGNVLIQGQEFHTSYWGHRGILNLKDHLLLPGYAGYPNTAASSLYPMNADVYDMAHEQGAVVGAVHPFDEVPDPFVKPAQRITDELPADVALGKLDYMEIVGFSDHKSTAEVWYKLLNLGFKLPAGAGTDATVNYAAPIRGQAGFNRVYIWIPATLDQWPDQLKKGQTFATNGPLLDFTMAAQTLGSELKFDAPLTTVTFSAKLRSIVPIDHLEIVCNGKVAQSLKLEGPHDSADLTGTLPLDESGWCVLRAWSNKAQYPVMDNYAYATTSPIYVTIAGKRAYSQKDAQYFLAWIDRTLEITTNYPDWNSPQEKEHVLKTLRDARAVYESLH
jgi:hypothetical protein